LKIVRYVERWSREQVVGAVGSWRERMCNTGGAEKR
jgi:hypothetical protein